jgi:DNA-binding NtrC family response regulator
MEGRGSVRERQRDGRRVLVIEDDAGIREMVALALGSAGYEVETSDGRTVRRPVDADVVLLDFRLEGRTADALLAEVPELGDRPIVLMTAVADGRTARSVIPASGMVQKPFDLRVLESAIETAMDEDARSD